MTSQPPRRLPGRTKLPAGRRFSRRVVFRLLPRQYDRLARRAAALGLRPNDYARTRALGRARPTLAQRRLAAEAAGLLERVTGFAADARSLLLHLEGRARSGGALAALLRDAAARHSDPLGDLDALRVLIEEAVHP